MTPLGLEGKKLLIDEQRVRKKRAIISARSGSGSCVSQVCTCPHYTLDHTIHAVVVPGLQIVPHVSILS